MASLGQNILSRLEATLSSHLRSIEPQQEDSGDPATLRSQQLLACIRSGMKVEYQQVYKRLMVGAYLDGHKILEVLDNDIRRENVSLGRHTQRYVEYLAASNIVRAAPEILQELRSTMTDDPVMILHHASQTSLFRPQSVTSQDKLKKDDYDNLQDTIEHALKKLECTEDPKRLQRSQRSAGLMHPHQASKLQKLVKNGWHIDFTGVDEQLRAARDADHESPERELLSLLERCLRQNGEQETQGSINLRAALLYMAEKECSLDELAEDRVRRMTRTTEDNTVRPAPSGELTVAEHFSPENAPFRLDKKRESSDLEATDTIRVAASKTRQQQDDKGPSVTISSSGSSSFTGAEDRRGSDVAAKTISTQVDRLGKGVAPGESMPKEAITVGDHGKETSRRKRKSVTESVSAGSRPEKRLRSQDSLDSGLRIPQDKQASVGTPSEFMQDFRAMSREEKFSLIEETCKRMGITIDQAKEMLKDDIELAKRKYQSPS